MSRAPKDPIVNPDERSKANARTPLAVLSLVIAAIGLLVLLLWWLT